MPSSYLYTTNSNSGYAYSTGATWSSVVNAPVADTVYVNNPSVNIAAVYDISSPECRISRPFLVFDTSDIHSDYTILTCELNYQVVGTPVNNTTFKIYKTTTPTLSVGLQTSDNDLTNFSTDYGDGDTYSVSIAGWQNISVGATGSLANDIKASSEITMVWRNYYDYTNTLPSVPSVNSFTFRLNHANKPYLWVEYLTPYGNIVSSVIPANIGMINTVSTQNIDVMNSL
jgi:hypothetical protein